MFDGFGTSLINKKIVSQDFMQHKLLINNESSNVLGVIRRLLKSCDEFYFSTAFITLGGVSLIVDELKYLSDIGVKGRIITGTYLDFTQPVALEKLLEFNNLDVLVVADGNFHAKGYFFRKGDIWTMIVGSSNLTRNALLVNDEWNIKFSSHCDGQIVEDVFDQLNVSVNRGVDCRSMLFDYKKRYDYKMLINSKVNAYKNELEEKSALIIPNSMQKQALDNLASLRLSDVDKALVVSATGTGKTYLSAFDVDVFGPKKCLFIVHSETILNSAKKTFSQVIVDKTFGYLGGGVDVDGDVVFAMIQTLSQDKYLFKYTKDAFDYIIVDEVHHAGALSYQKVVDYFSPKFLLGMTATPERGDDFNIYEMFDYNIASEIRLRDAMDADLLCPFSYYGVSDDVDDYDTSSLDVLTSDQRVLDIINKSKFYGYSGATLKCLVFASRIDEASILCDKFNQFGYKAVSLSGNDSSEYRSDVIRQLELGYINYIITVGIFNEGIDIPCVNQVILLRKTQSSIIYIQQLGRGLRKYYDKEYVVVIDFIGNYKTNFLIPIALSGNNTYDKDTLKRFLNDGTSQLPGLCSVSFDYISKGRIFDSIETTNFSQLKFIKENYVLLENKLGRVPMLCDFYDSILIHPSVILKYKNNYFEVLKSLKVYDYNLCELETNFLNFISKELGFIKRRHEIIIIKYLIDNQSATLEQLNELIEQQLMVENQVDNTVCALNHLDKTIFTSLSDRKVFEPLLIKVDESYALNEQFRRFLEEDEVYYNIVIDTINYIDMNLSDNYKQIDMLPLLFEHKYTRKDAYWVTNNDFNNGYQVGGYTDSTKTLDVLMFITLDDSGSFTNYSNKFLSNNKLTWYSKKQLTKDLNSTENKLLNDIYNRRIFIRKASSEDFYYIGKLSNALISNNNYEDTKMLEYTFTLENSISEELYEYLF